MRNRGRRRIGDGDRREFLKKRVEGGELGGFKLREIGNGFGSGREHGSLEGFGDGVDYFGGVRLKLEKRRDFVGFFPDEPSGSINNFEKIGDPLV